MNHSLALLVAVVILAPAAARADGSAWEQLRAQAGDSAPQAAAPVAARRAILPPPPDVDPAPADDDSDDAPRPPALVPVPAGAQPVLACVMKLNYRVTSDQLLILRLAKHIDGTAVIVCPDRRIPLRIQGWGFAPGLGIPNRSPFQSVNGGFAGNIEVRIPTVFAPKDLEGTYVSGGVDVLGVGPSVSPWTNTDGSAAFTLYLPKDLDLSFGFDITSIQLRLM